MKTFFKVMFWICLFPIAVIAYAIYLLTKEY